MKTADVLKHFGGCSKTAAAIGVKPAAVSVWGDEPPLLRQYQIEVITKRKLRANTGNVAS
jgi:hypothetical protein